MIKNVYEMCENQRRKYGLILIQDNVQIQCRTECSANDTCPLNPKNRQDLVV